MTEEPKPQTEVTEETRETLSVLEQARTPRPEKLRLERAYFDGAHEVRYTERSFRPHHKATLHDIRAAVDALEIRRQDDAPAALERAPEVAPPEPAAVPRKVPDHYRVALEPVVRGTLTSVETVHRVGVGTVVEATWEPSGGGSQRGLFLIDDGRARPYDDVAARIDALPAPVTTTAEPAARMPASKEPVATSEPPAEEAPKKRRFGLKRGK